MAILEGRHALAAQTRELLLKTRVQLTPMEIREEREDDGAVFSRPCLHFTDLFRVHLLKRFFAREIEQFVAESFEKVQHWRPINPTSRLS